MDDPLAFAAAYPDVYLPGVDPNDDGNINLLDIPNFVLLLTGGGGASGTVPEPSALLLGASAWAVMAARRRAHQ